MLALLCSWLIQVLVFLSWGNMLTMLWCNLAKKQNRQLTLFDTFWIGICAVGCIVSIFSIFTALSFYLLMFFIGSSLIYFLWKINSFTKQTILILGRLKQSPQWVSISLLVAFIAILFFALTTPLLYDEGLYHLQTMLWSEHYSIIPGLGNLHGRLAFNSNFLLLSTLFNYHPDWFGTFFSINSLALLVLVVWIITKVREKKHLVERLVLILIALLCIFSFGIYLSSTSTDILANVLIIYLLLTCVLDQDAIKNRILLFFIMPIFCVTLKLSSALIALFPLYLFVRMMREKERNNLYKLIGLSLVVVAPWLVRFVVLSGYLIYPFPAIDVFNFDWKIPLELVQLEKDLAHVWPIAAHLPPAEVLQMSVLEWFPLWKSEQSTFVLSLYTLVVASPIVVLFFYKFWRSRSEVILAWIVAFSGCLFGFFTAPDARFSFGFIICAGLIPLMFFLSTYLSRMKISEFLSALAPMVFIVGLLALVYVGYSQTKYYQSEYESMYSLIKKPQTINYKKMEKASHFIEQKIGGMTFYYPDNSNQCFDQLLPCIPHYNGELEMRGKSLTDGFRVRTATK